MTLTDSPGMADMLYSMSGTADLPAHMKSQDVAPQGVAVDSGLSFEQRTLAVLGDLRASIQTLIAGLPDPPAKAADLRRALKIDAALAWQVFSLAYSGELLRTGRLVPKSGAMKRFVEAATAAGASADAVASVVTAYAEFEKAVREVAGDRRSFDAILSGLCPDDESALLRLRRAAYRANASVWGVSVRTTVHAVVFYERPTGEHDCLALCGRVGLRKLHAGATIGIYASSRTWGGPTPPPESGKGVALEGLGRRGEVTVYWRNLTLNFPGGTRVPPHGTTVPVMEPSELLVVDLIIPHGWADPGNTDVWVTPESSRYATVNAGASPHRLPFEGAAEYLGSNFQSLRTPHAPGYDQMMAEQLEELGWRCKFDIIRCQVEYPVLHSAVNLCVKGPAA
jgi:hypothetical protein